MAVLKGVAHVGSLSIPFARCLPNNPDAVQGSTDVKVNNFGVHRKTDLWRNHTCTWGNTYEARLRAGAPTVKANGLEVGRVSDPVVRTLKLSGNAPPQTGAVTLVLTGSTDTFIGQGAGSTGIYRFIVGSDTARAGEALSGIR